ncbi:MAG: STAS/SEC14 domain-containing protein [Gammaproteobacteria bacterium]
MFKMVTNGPNRVDIEFSGKLDSDEMRIALDELIAKTKGIEHGRMLYRIGDFNIPTLGAMGVELSRLPKLFGLIRQFDRVAVLADQDWVQKISEIEGALIPGLKIRAFDLDEEAEAERWLAN